MDYQRKVLTRRSKPLKIEAPGCIINIRPGLTNDQDEEVVSIMVSPDGARYADDPLCWHVKVPQPDGSDYEADGCNLRVAGRPKKVEG